MDIKFIMLYFLNFVVIVFNCWKLGELKAQLDIIQEELENR